MSWLNELWDYYEGGGASAPAYPSNEAEPSPEHDAEASPRDAWQNPATWNTYAAPALEPSAYAEPPRYADESLSDAWQRRDYGRVADDSLDSWRRADWRWDEPAAPGFAGGGVIHRPTSAAAWEEYAREQAREREEGDAPQAYDWPMLNAGRAALDGRRADTLTGITGPHNPKSYASDAPVRRLANQVLTPRERRQAEAAARMAAAGGLRRGGRDGGANPSTPPPKPDVRENPELLLSRRWREGVDKPALEPAPWIPNSPKGGDPANPWGIGLEWLTGVGPRHHEFRAGDEFTELLKTHDHVQQVRQEIARRLQAGNYKPGRHDYQLEGWEGIPKYAQDYSNVLTLGHTGNLAATFLGSYDLEYYVLDVSKAGTARVLFHVSNVSNLASATHPPVLGYTPLRQENVEPGIDALTQSGPMSPVTQDFWWAETIRFK